MYFQCDYHDVNDIYSCQLNCKTIPSCNYFTMFDDTERNQKKCFHFAQCGESCPECTTGTTEGERERGREAESGRESGMRLNWICQEF